MSTDAARTSACATSSDQQAGNGNDQARDAGDDADHWKQHLARDEIERTQHQRDLQQAFAQIVMQRAALGGLRCFLLTRRLLLEFLGLIGVLLLIFAELLQGLARARIAWPQ